MATFDATQQSKLVRILRVNPITLAARLGYYAPDISDEMKADVLTLITEWETGTTARNITKIRANDKNFGAEINPDELRSIIRGEIAELLFCTDLVSSSGQFRLVRG